MSLQSQAISRRMVIASDTEPATDRLGLVWINTAPLTPEVNIRGPEGFETATPNVSIESDLWGTAILQNESTYRSVEGDQVRYLDHYDDGFRLAQVEGPGTVWEVEGYAGLWDETHSGTAESNVEYQQDHIYITDLGYENLTYASFVTDVTDLDEIEVWWHDENTTWHRGVLVIDGQVELQDRHFDEGDSWTYDLTGYSGDLEMGQGVTGVNPDADQETEPNEVWVDKVELR